MASCGGSGDNSGGSGDNSGDSGDNSGGSGDNSDTSLAQDAYNLDQQHGLNFTGDYYEDWGGMGEKWMQGNGGIWYFITADGSFYQWHGGSMEESTQLATLDGTFHADPTKLHDAPAMNSVSSMHTELSTGHRSANSNHRVRATTANVVLPTLMDTRIHGSSFGQKMQSSVVVSLDGASAHESTPIAPTANHQVSAHVKSDNSASDYLAESDAHLNAFDFDSIVEDIVAVDAKDDVDAVDYIFGQLGNVH